MGEVVERCCRAPWNGVAQDVIFMLEPLGYLIYAVLSQPCAFEA